MASQQRRGMNMHNWAVGPVPDYLYGSNQQQQPDGGMQYVQPQAPNSNAARLPSSNPHAYPPDLSRRNDQYSYHPVPPQQQQHHQAPPQAPMNVQPTPVPAPQAPPAPAPAPAPARQRKRPASSQAPTPAAAPAPVPVPVPVPVPAPPVQQQAPPPPVPAPQQPKMQQQQPQQQQQQQQSQAPVPAPVTAPAPAQPAPATTDDSATPPAPKKSRTNTPWTPAEELRLKQMRDAGNSWADIAKTFPSRTEGSVKKHWYKDMHYAEFAEDESQALLNAIKEYENNKWKVIGQKVGKPAKACEQYAKEHFPEIFASSSKSR